MTDPSLLYPSDVLYLHPVSFIEVKSHKPFFNWNRLKGISSSGDYVEVAVFVKLLIKETLLYLADNNFIQINSQGTVIPGSNTNETGLFEKRLIPEKETSIGTLIQELLVYKCRNPYVIIFEMGQINQVIKGRMRVKVKIGEDGQIRSGRYYWLDKNPIMNIDTIIQTMMTTREERSLRFKHLDLMLETEIAAGLDMCKPQQFFSKVANTNPWNLESPENRKKYTSQKPSKITVVFLVAFFIVIIGVMGKMLFREIMNEHAFVLFNACWIILTLVIFGFLLFFSANANRFHWFIAQCYTIASGKVLVHNTETEYTKKIKILNYLGAVFFLSLYMFLVSGLIYAAFFKGAGFILLLFLLPFILLPISPIKRIIAKSIIDQVGKSQATSTITPTHSSTVRHQELTENKYYETRKNEAKLKFDIITVNEFPETSQESNNKFININTRFMELIKLYSKRILVLAICTIVLTGNLNDAVSPLRKLYFGLFIFTLAWMGFIYILAPTIMRNYKRLVKEESLYKYFKNKGRVKKPNITPFIGILWSFIAISYAVLDIYHGLSFSSIIFNALLIAVVVWYFIITRKDQVALEAKMPLPFPFRLLILRVFGSNGIRNFMNLIDSWRYFGVTQYLDGSDSTGQKLDDIINFFKGKTDLSIVENKEELDKEILKFSMLPDQNARFPVCSMQCNNVIWKEAFQHFMDNSDIIVIDLSGLNKNNAGIRYEIEKIITEIPLSKIIFLLSNTSDRELLFSIITEVVKSLPPGSVNYSDGEINIRFFLYAGGMAQKQDETVKDWKKRINLQLIDQNLVCLMYDIAKNHTHLKDHPKEINLPWAKWTWRDLRIYIEPSE